jgi:hypothetical protein
MEKAEREVSREDRVMIEKFVEKYDIQGDVWMVSAFLDMFSAMLNADDALENLNQANMMILVSDIWSRMNRVERVLMPPD